MNYYHAVVALLLIGVSAFVSAQDAIPVNALQVAGIAYEPGDDEPRVLYIMPWQPPTLPRRSRTELTAESPTLMKPLNPVVLERHRQFKQTLNPEMGSGLSLQ